MILIIFTFIPGFLFSQIDMDEIQADENFQWGVRGYHNGYFNQAIFYFEKALGFKPLHVPERLWLGKALYKSGFEEAALNEWNSLLERGKGTTLLENSVRIITMRRGFGPEIAKPEPLVISSIIDASKEMYRQFKRPTGIRSRKDGSLYIVAFGTNEIIRVNANGTILDVFKGGLEGFDHPFDIIESEEGFLYISEYEGNRISKCNTKGERIQTIGKKGIGAGELLGPQFMAIDSKGYLYVTDFGNKRVNKYNQDGEFILSFGGRKNGKRTFDGPTGIAIVHTTIFVSDVRKKTIFAFDESGNLLKTYDNTFLWGPEGMYSDGSDSLYIADTAPFAEKTRVVTFNIPGEKWSVYAELGKEARRLLHLTIDPNGDLFVTDYNQNKIISLSPLSSLSSGFFVQIERIDAQKFPEIMIDVSVQDRYGKPVIGLSRNNFIITESSTPVHETFMYKPVRESENFEIVLLIEKSLQSAQLKKEIKAGIKDLFSGLGKTIGNTKGIMIVSAGKDPVFEADVNASRLEKVDVVNMGKFSDAWRFDTGLRLAATKLLPFRTKRAIIFISSGNLPSHTFSDHSILELTHYMKNNYIKMYTIHIGNGKIHDDIAFLCKETGGDVYSFHAPEGISHIIDRVKNQTDPRYILSYQTTTDPRFGKKFISSEVEVNMRKRTGRDESGYFGPIE
jgi:hypothetical protein